MGIERGGGGDRAKGCGAEGGDEGEICGSRDEGSGLGLELGLGGLGQGRLGRPGGEENGQGPNFWALFSLSLQNSSKNRKAKKERERKEMSGQEFGHGGNFPGLAKMRLFQEK